MKFLIVILSTFYCCIQADEKEDRRCFTPDAQLGTCIELSQCPVLANLSSTEENNGKREIYKCLGSDKCKNYVCCPPGQLPSNPIRMNIKDCPISAAPPNPKTACCGVDASTTYFIKGGNETTVYEYPWMALLEYELGGIINDYKICGGSLITRKYVLTAAHCVHPRDLQDNKVRVVLLGVYSSLDCLDEPSNSTCIRTPIQSISHHEDYTDTTTGNDIALIRLTAFVRFNDYIRPICLPRSNEFDVKSKFYVAGWGRDDSGGLSDNKRHVMVPYVPRQECAKIWSKISESHICAGGEAGKDSCDGDSGGPLMSYDSTTKIFSLNGIVSYGTITCGQGHVPGVYTNVYKFLPWIRSKMKP